MKRKFTVLLSILMLFTSLPIFASAEDKVWASGSDIVVLKEHSYRFMVADSMTYYQTEKYCEDLGGHLITISSQAENDLVVSFMKDLPSGYCMFIGLSDIEKEGDWSKWVTGEPVTYTNWGSKEPDNLGNQDLALVCNGDSPRWGIKKGQWDDNFDQYSKIGGFVCEWDYAPVNVQVLPNGDVEINHNSDYILGDVNFDGKITSADARLVLRASVGLEYYARTSEQFKRSDVNNDEKISSADARLILRGSVGLEDISKWKKS